MDSRLIAQLTVRAVPPDLPDARLVEIEGAGHLLWAERPRRVRAAVHLFLTSEERDEPRETSDETEDR